MGHSSNVRNLSYQIEHFAALPRVKRKSLLWACVKHVFFSAIESKEADG